ncbi:MAG: hypothetical protein AAGH41_10050 [Pseudomonadota bacterium]
MPEAPSETQSAPFASVRSQGFLFKTQALKRGVVALQRAWQTNVFPVVLSGPEGLGKKAMVSAWVRKQPKGSITAARVEAADLTADNAVSRILNAFGQRPLKGASAEGALADFLEDCVFDQRPGFLLVSDLHRAPASVWDALERLSRARGKGGLGLPLCGTTAEPVDAHNAVRLSPMTLGEVERFTRAVYDAFGAEAEDKPFGPAPFRALHAESRGLPGLLGPAIDAAFRAHRSASAKPAPRVSEPVKAPEPAPAPEAAPAPTPADIEEALLALQREPQTDTDRPTARSGSRHFPKIAVGSEARVTADPANDPKDNIAPKIAQDLEAVAREISGLQGHLIVVRDQAAALEKRLDARKRTRAAATERFVGALRQS